MPPPVACSHHSQALLSHACSRHSLFEIETVSFSGDSLNVSKAVHYYESSIYRLSAIKGCTARNLGL